MPGICRGFYYWQPVPGLSTVSIGGKLPQPNHESPCTLPANTDKKTMARQNKGRGQVTQVAAQACSIVNNLLHGRILCT